MQQDGDDEQMDMKEIANEMKELEIKAGKYDDIKEDMDKTLGLINEKFSEIQELFTRLSPAMIVKGKKRGSYGGKTLDYIEKCYKHIIEHPDEEFTARKLLDDVGLGNVYGGSEQVVRSGLVKLPGMSKRQDPNRSTRQLIKYSGKLKHPENMPEFIKETVKGNKVGGVPDAELIDDDTEELLKSVPNKVSHMG